MKEAKFPDRVASHLGLNRPIAGEAMDAMFERFAEVLSGSLDA